MGNRACISANTGRNVDGRNVSRKKVGKRRRLLVFPWDGGSGHRKSSDLYAYCPYNIPIKEEDIRTKIDGLKGSDDSTAFHGMQRKDTVNFLQRSLSDRENANSEGIRRIERIKSGRLSRGRPDLCVYVVTWNMNGKEVSRDELAKLLGERQESFDFYVVGLQEAPTGDIASVIHRALGRHYSLVGSAVMLSLQLFIFARKACESFIKEVRVDKFGGGGFGGIVGRQKGAVAITFNFKETSFLFISCHLSPHESNVEERNAQYQRICQTLFSKPSRRTQSCLQSPNRLMDHLSGCKGSQSPVNPTSIETTDVVVWLGDLNYRIEGSRKSVGFLINQNLQKLLRARDQLSREAERGEIFHGFCEGPLSFPPTYKYDIGTDDYDTSAKERVPSWTDRILYKVKRSSNIKAYVQDYDCIDSLRGSDHRPVKAHLCVKLGRPLNINQQDKDMVCKLSATACCKP